MKNLVICFTFAVFTVCMLSNSVKAQNDFVVTINNDTLRGTITSDFFGQHRFKVAGSAKHKFITVADTKEYFIMENNANFCKVLLPQSSSPKFLKRLEKGKIELFEFIKSSQGGYNGLGTYYTNGSTTYWYFSKDKSPLTILKHNNLVTFSKENRRNEFYELIKDNEVVGSQFLAEDKFSFARIREMLQLYNFDASKITQ